MTVIVSNTEIGRNSIPSCRGVFQLRNRKREVMRVCITKNLKRRVKEFHRNKKIHFAYIYYDLIDG